MKAGEPMNLVVLCDFDGTIVDIDTVEFTLNMFAIGDWRIYDKKFLDGEMGLEECLRKQFALVRASKQLILKELAEKARFRQNFEKLTEYCSSHRIPFIIVSAGLDFVIKHFLKLNHCLELVEICAPKSRSVANSIKLAFPRLLDRTSVNLKDDLVRYYQKEGKRTAYIGDGTADFPAIRIADFPFVIETSALAKLCKKMGVSHREITDFQEVISEIRDDYVEERD